MASHLDKWERDPFFSAAEEVQESADRMESTYRTLIQALKEPSAWNSEALRRDLRTTLGTTKWQLEEFEKAVIASYDKNSTDDTKDRHRDFITAMETQISRVENLLSDSNGKPPRPWVRLDEGERKELALFLSGSTKTSNEQPAKTRITDEQRGRRKQKVGTKGGKFSGHRRTASAGPDIRSWKITVGDDDNVSGNGKIGKPPRKTPSVSGLLNTLESASKLKWPNNGYKKLSQDDDDDGRPSETRPLTRGMKESSKICPKKCDDKDKDKRVERWYGGIQRLCQRSQYYMLYNRPTQIIVLLLLVILCLLAFV